LTLAKEDFRERIRQALASQKRPTVTVLSSLLAAQDGLGYLPNEAIEEVADRTGASINEVWGVATFYTNFRFTPPAEHLVEVCWGPTCHLLGAPDILKRVQDDLGLDGEGDTADGRVTLKYNTCLGACSQAPVMSIDHRLRGRLGTDLASSLLAGLADQSP
jgi:NADH:ubiquinone oxidoreductase subunit E